MSGYGSGEVSWFVPPFSLSQLCQSDHKKEFIKEFLSNSEHGISKTRDKFLTTTVIIPFNNNKTRCTYFNPLMPGGSKRSNVLKQAYSQKLLFILRMYDFCYHPPSIRVLKGETAKEECFGEFIFLALFKETLILS